MGQFILYEKTAAAKERQESRGDTIFIEKRDDFVCDVCCSVLLAIVSARDINAVKY